MILPLRSSLIVGVKRVGPVLRGRAGLKVLSGIGVLSRPKLASDGGSAEVVHALVRIRRDGLIRAMRPGGDAPTEPDAPPQPLSRRRPQAGSAGTRGRSSTPRAARPRACGRPRPGPS